jgi:RimJ/RimL family protein N-acetyltransferase
MEVARMPISSTAPVEGDMLHGPRLRLQPFATDDLAWFSALHGDARVMAHMRGGPQTAPQAKALLQTYLDTFAANGFGMWVIRDRDQGRRLGECGVMDWRADYGDFAARVALDPDAWGQGYATEALTVVLDHVLGAGRLPRLLAFVTDDNHASIRLLRGLGFPVERVEPHGEVTVLRHCLTAKAWQAIRGKGGAPLPRPVPPAASAEA